MKYINLLFDLVALDGCKHIVLSALITVILNIFLPIWSSVLITAVLGGLKEYYDYKSNTGLVQIKDIICNVVGILIGCL